MSALKIHVEVFIASRMLSQRQGSFTTEELRREVERLFGDTRPGVNAHISAHCVANAPRSAQTVYNYLWRIERGHLRTFDPVSDRPHPSRADAAFVPKAEDVPPEYRHLAHWE